MTTVPLDSRFRAMPAAIPDPIELGDPGTATWDRILHAVHGTGSLGEAAGAPVYGPLIGTPTAGEAPRGLVIGQFGQSLDGRIATPSGESKYLNGPGGLVHLHRLRALVDAVVVGVSTAAIDDPLLTVRMVTGPSPARVVIDPRGRVDARARLFSEDGARRVVITAAATRLDLGPGIEIVRIGDRDGQFDPAEIVAALAAIGLQRLLIEGGADTVSRFLEAGALDRLHVSVAPVLVGGGRSGISLSNVRGLSDCLRPKIEVHRLGEDILFDCALKA